ncbi:outer membrane receptor protein involved in Fe transport [Wenyingzhuangia heitensis]|uniref:Outer membrane receptor protein involved in Fe transport n=1 Tax=Wenyingzhuangia heitensis TaxID=1487859 RepID=A0ABX0U938_9FLAO|nr:outer membrane beta-barrel family protein [Wenyingzhuangia heitensis]NIJ45263.1 outer membrane receptor protein involved in Fe transport [Wenyingzhuangia heitensis]
MKNRLPKIVLLILVLLGNYSLMGQQKNAHIVLGEIKDGSTQTTIPYATISVVNAATKQILSGTISNDAGTFSIKTTATDFYVEISFMGFKTKTIKDIDVKQSRINLGTVILEEDSEQLAAVEVRAEVSKTQFKLDRKVFNVGKDIASTGVSALEVLNNVPSVNVNIEGEVSLRGSGGVQILIDGKPSVLADDSSNALGTITADMIESIEVITNPSAKYDAEGTAGLLNIILKKEEKRGLNGSISLNTGTPDNHSVGVSLNRRTEKFNLFTQLGGGYRSMPRDNENSNLNKENDSKVESYGTNYRNESFFNFILGTDYHIDDYNVLTLSGNVAYEWEDQPSRTNYRSFDNDVLNSEWYRVENTQALNPKWQYEFNYKKEFKNNKEHTLLFSALGRFFGKDTDSDFNNATTFGTNDQDQLQETNTDFQQSDYTFKLDYTNPITDEYTIEAGSQYVINDVGNDYEVRDYNGTEFVADPELTNNFEYNQKVLAVYGTGAFEGNNWGLKLGLRVENTDLKTLLTNNNQENNQTYTDFFPSLHTSYKVTDDFSVQAGYSKRIYRPRLWDLNPFFSIRDNFNIRAGNPNLLPEYTNSFEVTGIYKIGKATMNSSVYHRYTTDVMERIAIFDDNVTTTTPFNIGTKNTTGVEVNGKYSPIKWLTFNGDFNWNYFSREGEYNAQNFDFDGDSWSSRVTSKIGFPEDIDLEITGNYRSSYKTVQGETSGFAFADIGLRKKILKGKAVINLAVRDLFASRISETIIDNDTTYQYSFGQRGRFFTLGFSYGFGKGEAMTYSGKRR